MMQKDLRKRSDVKLQMALTKIYTQARRSPCDTDKSKELGKSLGYIVRWCVKHGADIPK